MRTITPILSLLLWLFAPLAIAQNAGEGMPRTPAPAGAEVYIQSPADGAEVHSPFVVRFGLRGMGIAPAGVTVPDKATGHHHLLIDVDTLPPEDKPLPSTEQVRHFGGGQTQTELNLPPGQHTLQLELGDANHVPFDPPLVSQKITITVVE